LSVGPPNCIHKTIKQPKTAIHPASVSHRRRWQARAIRLSSPGMIGRAAWRQLLLAGVPPESGPVPVCWPDGGPVSAIAVS
jgi:hypothetical protein